MSLFSLDPYGARLYFVSPSTSPVSFNASKQAGLRASGFISLPQRAHIGSSVIPQVAR